MISVYTSSPIMVEKSLIWHLDIKHRLNRILLIIFATLLPYPSKGRGFVGYFILFVGKKNLLADFTDPASTYSSCSHGETSTSNIDVM